MSRFELLPCVIRDLVVLERKPSGDARGYLERLFCEDELASVLGRRRPMQINRTMTAEVGVLRGLHFQHPPCAEMKIISCLRGAVFDVAVDLRQGSDTFLHWHAEELSAENNRSLLIPEGFAHGFQTLKPGSELLYIHTAAYIPEAEGGLDALDPRLAIEWPEPITARSSRDENHPPIDAKFLGLKV